MISNDTLDGKFPGGKTTRYGLKAGGVDIALTNTTADTNTAIKEAKQKIIDGDIKVPEK